MSWVHHPQRGVVRWRVHLRSSPEVVYRFLSTDEGRASFWAESAQEEGGTIHWEFSSGASGDGAVLERIEASRFALEYFDGSVVEFDVESDGREGTDLTLTNRSVPEETTPEVAAAWVSVLLNMKSVIDSGTDLRNHDSDRSWDRGFTDN